MTATRRIMSLTRCSPGTYHTVRHPSRPAHGHRRRPTFRSGCIRRVALIVYGAAGDIGPLTAAMIRGAWGLMLWNPDNGHRSALPQGPVVRSRWPVGGRGGELTAWELQVLHGMSPRAVQPRNRPGTVPVRRHRQDVKKHSRRIIHKLGARDRAHAVALGLRTGLLS